MLTTPIYFNHIPKCAGTTLNELLARAFSLGSVAIEPFIDSRTLYTADYRTFGNFELVGSHFPHWAAMKRMPTCSKLTVLRQPWSRFQALCRHIKRDHRLRGVLYADQIAEFVSLVENGAYTEALGAAKEWYGTQSSMVAGFASDPMVAPVATADLEIAIANLNTYDLVLTTQDLDRDAPLLDLLMNGSRYGISSHANTSKSVGEDDVGPFPDSCEEMFNEQFPYESDLYRKAQVRHAVTVDALRGAVEGSGGWTRLPTRRLKPLFILDWTKPTKCFGFSDRVVAQSRGYHGRIARFVAGAKAILEFEIESYSGGSVRLEAVFWASVPNARRRILMKLNGTPLECFDSAHEVISPYDEHQIWTFSELEAPESGCGSYVLELDISETEEPCELWLLDVAVLEDVGTDVVGGAQRRFSWWPKWIG